MSEDKVKDAAKKSWYRKLMDNVNPNRKKLNEAYDKAKAEKAKKKSSGY